MSALTRGVHVTPGPTGHGAVLHGIAPGDAMSVLGLRDGDVLLEVAGNVIDGPDKALEAYAVVSRAETVSVRLLRRGQRWR